MIIAFDTSAKRTGWVRGKPGGPVQIGSFGVREAARSNLGRLVHEWAEQAWPLIEGCTHVYFEAPMMPSAHSNFASQRVLYALTAHVEFLAFHAQAECMEISAGTHKKLIYDHGGAKPLNAIDYAAAWGLPARNDDESDACGVFLAGVRHEFPRAFKGWLTIRAQAPLIARVAKPNKRRRLAPSEVKQLKRANAGPALL